MHLDTLRNNSPSAPIKIGAALICTLLLATVFVSQGASAQDGQTCAMLIDFGNGRVEWADVPVHAGMNGFDVFLNATQMLGLSESHSPTPPYGHTVLRVEEYTMMYNFDNPSASQEVWHMYYWNAQGGYWYMSPVLLDGIDAMSTPAIALAYIKDPSIPPTATPDNRYPWSSSRHDSMNLGSALNFEPGYPTFQWQSDLGNGAIKAPVTTGANVYQNSAESAEKYIYAISSGIQNNGVYETNSMIHSLDSFGGERWSANLGMGEEFGAPLAFNRKVYAPSADGNLYAFNAQTGSLLWSFSIGTSPSGIQSSPTQIRHLVIVAGTNGVVYGVEENGGYAVWSTTVAPSIYYSSPAAKDGKIYIGGDDGSLHAIDSGAGGELWSVQLGDRVRGSPMLLSDQIIVTYSLNDGDTPTGGGVAAVSYDGALLWQTDVGYTTSDASYTGDGVIVTTAQAAALVGLDGAVRWTANVDEALGPAPISVNGSSFVITGGPESKIIGIGSDGVIDYKQTMSPSQAVVASPSISDGLLYVPSESGRLNAYIFEGIAWPEDPDNPPPSPTITNFNFQTDGLNVTFSASSINESQVTNYSWDFGDGQVGQGKTVKHNYSAEGNYSVMLKVDTSDGNVTNVTKVVSLDSSNNGQNGAPGPTSEEFPIWGWGALAIVLIAGAEVILLYRKKLKSGK